MSGDTVRVHLHLSKLLMSQTPKGEGGVGVSLNTRLRTFKKESIMFNAYFYI